MFTEQEGAMPDTTDTTTDDGSTSTDTTTDDTTTQTTQQQGDQLGDAGKRALDEERNARREAERKAKAAERQLEQLRQQSMSDGDKAVAQAKAEGKAEALAASNSRLVRSEVRVAAAGKLADPADAVRFLDLEDFKVDDDGEVDGKAISKAIDQLLKDKPYLAAGTTKVQGSGDGGARGGGQEGIDMNAVLRRAAGRQ